MRYISRKLAVLNVSFFLSCGSAVAAQTFITDPSESDSFGESFSETTFGSVIDYSGNGDEVGQPVTPESSASLNSSALGFSGPLVLSTDFSSNYGWILGGKYAIDIGESNALALDLELGAEQNRINATWGFAFTDEQRLKLTFERLAQKLDFSYDSGDIEQWVPQYAGGIGYQYILKSDVFRSLDANAYYAKAKSSELSSVSFVQDGTPKTNYRRIAGGTSRGLSFGMGLQPWANSLLNLDVYYDDLTYDMKYQSSDQDTKGVGGSASLEQVITDHFKARSLLSMRAMSNEYAAGVSYLVPNMSGVQIELGLDVGYLDAKSTGRDDTTVGFNVAMWFGNEYTANNSVYQGYSDPAVKSLKDWTREAAVRMTEVYAIADQVSKSQLVQSSGIDSPTYNQGEVIDYDVSSSFSTEDGTLTYSYEGDLPQGVEFSETEGRFFGTAPNVSTTEKYPITVTAENTWGYSSSSNFEMIILQGLAAPITTGNPTGSVVQNTTDNTLDMSQYFDYPDGTDIDNLPDPNDAAFTYSIDSAPESWTDLQIDQTSGVMTGTAPAYVDGTGDNSLVSTASDANTYEIKVKATNGFGSSAVSTVTVDVTSGIPDSTAPTVVSSDTQQLDAAVDEAFTYSTADDFNGDVSSYTLEGTLPDGLSLNQETGLISGTPTESAYTGEDSEFSVKAMGEDGVSSATKNYEMSIDFPPQVIDSAVASLSGSQNIQFSYQSADDFKGEVAEYKVVAGLDLPEGLELNTTTGEISGAPTGNGNSFAIQALGPDSGSDSDDPAIKAYNMSVDFLSVAIAAPLDFGEIKQGELIKFDLDPFFTGSSFTYSVDESELPDGIYFDGDHTLRGAASKDVPGGSHFPVTIEAVDSNPNGGLASSVSQTADMLISSNDVYKPVTSSGTEVDVADQYYVGVPITPIHVAPAFDGDVDAYMSATSDDVLPKGLTLDPYTGVITGTPDEAVSNLEYTVNARGGYEDSGDGMVQSTASTTLTFNVVDDPVTFEGYIKDQYYTIGEEMTVDFSDKFEVEDDQATIEYELLYAYADINGIPTLDGLTFDTSTGVLSGMPSGDAEQKGVSWIVVAKDQYGYTVESNRFAITYKD